MARKKKVLPEDEATDLFVEKDDVFDVEEDADEDLRGE